MKNRPLQIILFFLLCLPLGVVGQLTVSGMVLDAGNNNAPMIGVTIQEKDTDKGTITDVDGRFTMTVASPDAVLIFRYTGYTTVEVGVNGRDQIEVTLTEESQVFNQVIVVGYGIQKKSDLTGAVSTVKGEDIARV